MSTAGIMGAEGGLKLLAGIGLMSLLLSSARAADCDLDEVVGYTLLASKTIEGRIEENGERKDDFEGCDFDRVIVFTDNTGVRCTSYGYQYAYRPDAYIFANGRSMKMCVEDEMYDVMPLR